MRENTRKRRHELNNGRKKPLIGITKAARDASDGNSAVRASAPLVIDGALQITSPEEPAARANTSRGAVLTVDVGGSKVKVLAMGETEPRRASTGPTMTPSKLVQVIRKLVHGWKYDAVSIGYPGLVGEEGPRAEPPQLGPGWVGFDYAAAFGCPVRMLNDAAMQALGSYEGGRMLFLGLGSALGSAMISDNVIVVLELGQVAYGESQTLGDVLSQPALKRLGRKGWTSRVTRIVPTLMSAFVADYVVLGGRNSKQLRKAPPGVRVGNNLATFRGGYRLWHIPGIQTLCGHGTLPAFSPKPAEWRVI